MTSKKTSGPHAKTVRWSSKERAWLGVGIDADGNEIQTNATKVGTAVRRMGVPASGLEWMEAVDWPEDVREQMAARLAKAEALEALRKKVADDSEELARLTAKTARQWERKYRLGVKEAAALMGLSQPWLYQVMEKYRR